MAPEGDSPQSSGAIDGSELLFRRIPLAGTFNLREVRDYRTSDGRTVRRGLLYRSDALHCLDDEGRAALRRLGIRTVLDLREPGERHLEPDRLQGVGATVVMHPVLNAGAGDPVPDLLTELNAIYTWIIAEKGPVLAAAIRELSRPGALPVVVHCTGGKDRTGIVIALLLSALGVNEETVVADFAVTELSLRSGFRRNLWERGAARGIDPMVLASTLSCDPGLARQVLSQVRASDGSATGYLLRHGLPEADLNALRETLLAPVPDPKREETLYEHARTRTQGRDPDHGHPPRTR